MNFKQLREKYRSKYPASLVAAAVKIALDMAGAMTPAVKKIEAMKRGLSNDPMVKDALRMANESVSEAMSAAEKKKRLDMIRKAVEKLNKKKDAQAMKDALAAIKAMESVQEATVSYKIDHINSVGDIEKELKKVGAKIVNTKSTRDGVVVKFNAKDKNKLKQLVLKHDKDAVNESNLQEGTWDIPDTKTKLQKLMDLVSKPFFGTTEKDVDKYLKLMPFGDDELYDDLGVLYFIPGSTKSKKFPKTDLNKVAMDSLNGRWLTAKKKGQGYDITHINFDVDMDEAIKRKSGNIRPGRRMKVDLSAGSKY